jgi:hypothetical protein
VSDEIYELGVPGGALNLNSTGYPDHGHYGDLSLQGKIPTAEPGIEPRTSWLLIRSSDHQATRLVTNADIRPSKILPTSLLIPRSKVTFLTVLCMLFRCEKKSCNLKVLIVHSLRQCLSFMKYAMKTLQ